MAMTKQAALQGLRDSHRQLMSRLEVLAPDAWTAPLSTGSWRVRDVAAHIAAWDRQADLCSQYLAKGRRVAVDGYLRSRSWEEEGKRRREVEVVARSVQFLSPSATEGGEVAPFEPAVA